MSNKNKEENNSVEKNNDGYFTNLYNRYIQSKQKYMIIGTLTGFIVVSSSFGIIHYNKNLESLYHVYLDGELIGTTNNKYIIQNWQSQELMKAYDKYDGLDLEITNDIKIEEEVKYKGSYDNYAIISQLDEKLNIEARGVEIVINDEVIGTVKDQATADRIITSIKQDYMPDGEKNKITASSKSENNIKSVELDKIEIKEDVSTNKVNIFPNDVVDEETMKTLLQKGTLEEKVYTVQAGDTISEIAFKFDLTTQQVYQMNPQLEGEIIHIGDELIVTGLTPKITVETQETIVEEREIPYKVIYKTDSSLYVNEQEVLVNGKEGRKEVEYSVIKENGIILENEIINEEVLEEPVDKVVLKGTKIIPSRGSGEVDWPTVGGYITSPYGSRWGSFHNGIDISGVSDYTIKAADNGTVIFTGWKTGYGYTVILDHGNGMTTLYAHLSKITVSYGDKIAKGQKIGVMGSTGRSTGTHLHFEVRINNVPKNPLNYVGQ